MNPKQKISKIAGHHLREYTFKGESCEEVALKVMETHVERALLELYSVYSYDKGQKRQKALKFNEWLAHAEKHDWQSIEDATAAAIERCVQQTYEIGKLLANSSSENRSSDGSDISTANGQHKEKGSLRQKLTVALVAVAGVSAGNAIDAATFEKFAGLLTVIAQFLSGS